MNEPKTDAIQPSHYQVGGLQAIEVIRAWNLSFCLGNTVKYLQRWQLKGGLEDLKKAKRYLEMEIEHLEQQENQNAN